MTQTVRLNSKGEKLYPFSMLKYGHNIELAYNHQRIICDEMQEGVRAWNDEAFERLDKLEEVYNNAIGSPIYWATGKEYSILTDASAWAEFYRHDRNN